VDGVELGQDGLAVGTVGLKLLTGPFGICHLLKMLTVVKLVFKVMLIRSKTWNVGSEKRQNVL
jgi:hypothetical protein